MSTEWTDAEVIVQATGESMEGKVRIAENGEVQFHREPTKGKPQPEKRYGFAMVWPHALVDIEQPTWMQVFWHLVAQMNPRNGVIRYDLGDLGQGESEIERRKAWRAIQELLDKGMVVKLGRAKVMVNPDLVWMGDAASQAVARVEFEKAKNDAVWREGQVR